MDNAYCVVYKPLQLLNKLIIKLFSQITMN